MVSFNAIITVDLTDVALGGPIVSCFAKVLASAFSFKEVLVLLTTDDFSSFLHPFNKTETAKNTNDNIDMVMVFFEFKVFIIDMVLK